MGTEVTSPLVEQRDYGTNGADQLEKNFKSLTDAPDLLTDQFKDRMKRTSHMINMTQIIDKVADDILGLEKAAVSPPGWSGTVKKMKEHKEITNPWALSWWMAKRKEGDSWGKGGKLHKKPEPHYKPEKKKKKKSSVDIIADIVNDIVTDEVANTIQPVTQIEIQPIEQSVEVSPVTNSSKGYSTEDRLQTADGSYIIVKTNYKEQNGEVLLEEYTIEQDGKTNKYDNVEEFCERLGDFGLL
jgi:hypothetical protein